MMHNSFLASLALLAPLVGPVIALEIKSDTQPGGLPSLTAPDEIAINRAEGRLFYRNENGAQVGGLLPDLDASGYLKFRSGMTLGRFQGGKFISQPDSLQIQGSGSTGDASGLNSSATGSVLSRLLSDRFSDNINVLDETGPMESPDIGINRAIAKAAARGGGRVIIPNKGPIYTLNAKIVAKSNVEVLGLGRPRLRMANGINQSVMEGDNYQALTGTNSGAGIAGFAIRNLILDGNRGNNPSPAATTGHCLAIYGRDFVIEDLYLTGCVRRGLSTEYGNGAVGSSPFNGRVTKLTVDRAGEEGWYNSVSDLHAVDINIRGASQNANAGFDAMWLSGHGSVRGGMINIWGTGTNLVRYALNITSSTATTIHGMHLETAVKANLHIVSDYTMIDGLASYNMLGTQASPAHVVVQGTNNRINMMADAVGQFSNPNATVLVLGETASGARSNTIRVAVSGFTGPIIDPTNSGGGNIVEVTGTQAAGSLYVGGASAVSPQPLDRVTANVLGAAGIPITSGGQAPNSIALGNGAVATLPGNTAIGNNARATGSVSTALGNNTLATGTSALATGSRSIAALTGEHAHSAGRAVADGDRQTRDLQWFGTVTDNAATEIFLGGFAANRAVLPDKTSWFGDVYVIGRNTVGGSDRFSAKITVSISRGTGANNVTLGSGAVTNIEAPTGYSVTATADTTNGSLKITVQGPTGKTVEWFAFGTLGQITG